MSRFLSLATLVLPLTASASLDDALAFLDATYAADRPGASVIIMKEGETLHEGGYGLANVEWGIPITPDTVFRVGSITKQFTAAAIMLLERRGALSVSDPITKYLPDYPTHGHRITIEQLLNHTSGIRSYTGIDGYMGNPVRADVATDELVDIFKYLPMDFAPGDAWSYNNSGYVLLGAIIEAVSGQSYESFIADNIAAPLELDSTVYGGPKLIPRRAAGYELDAGGQIVNAGYISMTQPHAAGSLLSTTRDLARWHRALTGGEFIPDGAYAKMTSPAVLNDGETYPYGYGLGMGQLRERRMIAHGGGIHGFSCYVLWLPDEDLYVAVLTNGVPAGPGPSTVARKLAAMVLDDPYPDRESIRLNDADLRGLAGRYTGPGLPPMEVLIDGDDIVLIIGDEDTRTLYAESREILFFEDSIEFIRVEREGDAAARLLFHFEEGVPPDILTRVTEKALWRPDAAPGVRERAIRECERQTLGRDGVPVGIATLGNEVIEHVAGFLAHAQVGYEQPVVPDLGAHEAAGKPHEPLHRPEARSLAQRFDVRYVGLEIDTPFVHDEGVETLEVALVRHDDHAPEQCVERGRCHEDRGAGLPRRGERIGNVRRHGQPGGP